RGEITYVRQRRRRGRLDEDEARVRRVTVDELIERHWRVDERQDGPPRLLHGGQRDASPSVDHWHTRLHDSMRSDDRSYLNGAHHHGVAHDLVESVAL